MIFAILQTRLKQLYYFNVSCNYTYHKNAVKGKLQCFIKTVIFLFHFNSGLIINTGKLHFKQCSAIICKCLTRMHYIHSQVKSRGPWTKKPMGQKGYYTCWSWAKTDVPSRRHGMEPVGEGMIPPTLVAGDLGRDSSTADGHRTKVL
jgi:hypothetical protein